MIAAIALLLGCQLAGEVINRLTGMPLPGSVIGLFLLLLWLSIRPRERPALFLVANWLIAHMAVMFVPAAVGVMQEGAVLSRYGLAILFALVVSTLLTLVISVLVFRAVAARKREER